MKTNHLRYEDIRTEIGYLRDSIVDGIRGGKKEWVNEGLELYKELAKVFIEKMKQLGEGYNRERALAESANIFGEWYEIRWLRDDIRDFINEAFLQNNPDVLKVIIYFPVSTASMAFNKKDFYIYHKFISWMPYVLKKSLRLADAELKEIALDRCWRYLKEFSMYHLDSAVKNATDPKEVDDTVGYSIHVLRIFLQMFKEDFDFYFNSEDSKIRSELIDYFQLVLGEYKELFHSDDLDNYELQLAILNSNIEQMQVGNDSNKGLTENKIHMLTSLKNYYKKLNILKRTALFGLNAWIMHCYENKLLNKDEYYSWHLFFADTDILQEITDIFIKSLERESDDEFGWDWWEIEEKGYSKVYTVEFDMFLKRLYCLRVIDITKNYSDDRIASTDLLFPDNFVYLVEQAQNNLISIIKDIYANRDNWPFIHDINIDPILAILTAVVKKHELRRRDKIINASLNADLIGIFRKEIIEAWRSKALLRDVLEVPEEAEAPPTGDAVYIGFNRLESKEYFIEGENSVITEYGKKIGLALASFEDRHVVSEITKSLETRSASGNSEEIINVLRTAKNELEKNGYKDIVWIAVNAFHILYELSKTSSIKKISENKQELLDMPLYSFDFATADEKDRNIFLIFDRLRIGNWKQYYPHKVFPDEEYLSIFAFMFAPITDEMASNLLHSQPDLKKREDGTEKPEDEAKRDLRQKIHFRMLEQIVLENINRAAGYKISVL